MVAIELSRKSGVPLYTQLKEKIRRQVESGSWQPGYKLPTERELASMLGVSRNTVSQAFRELEAEGVLTILQGRGTFLAANDPGSLKAGRAHRLEELVGEALDHALDEGYTCQDFSESAVLLAEKRLQLLSHVRIVFVECNREQVDFFSKQLQLGSGVVIAPVVLDELRDDQPAAVSAVAEADLIVTTFFHEEEVRVRVPEGKRVLAVALDPQLETIVRIARIPRGSKLGLVCISATFAEKVVASINDAGIDSVPMVCTADSDSSRLREVVDQSDVLLVSPGRKREVTELCVGPREVVEFVYRPDMGSINLLKKAILELRERGV
ncbi:MAG TPA: GntR family transcriptional regulator [Bacillota bacterium]|nr:GntR family transcriptional regulator [Bacillota bacterium]